MPIDLSRRERRFLHPSYRIRVHSYPNLFSDTCFVDESIAVIIDNIDIKAIHYRIARP
jgi:hypothetical protein